MDVERHALHVCCDVILSVGYRNFNPSHSFIHHHIHLFCIHRRPTLDPLCFFCNPGSVPLQFNVCMTPVVCATFACDEQFSYTTCNLCAFIADTDELPMLHRTSIIWMGPYVKNARVDMDMSMKHNGPFIGGSGNCIDDHECSNDVRLSPENEPGPWITVKPIINTKTLSHLWSYLWELHFHHTMVGSRKLTLQLVDTRQNPL